MSNDESEGLDAEQTVTDAPPPEDREDFLEWMVGRDFAFEQAGRDGDVLFHAADWFEKREDVPEGLGPSDLENVSSKSVYLRCTVLDSEDVEVEGDKATATVERVLPPEASNASDAAVLFDTIRAEWRKGVITEL